MDLFSTAEINVLRNFKDWAIVSKNDEVILNRYANIGFVQFGFNWDDMVETAKMTELGLKHL